ncbi:MAG: hypothetical protein IKC18_07320 [Bacteroidaceae bacterium]|nr:hypothetical protein [Bacteroidaceae bacterium]
MKQKILYIFVLITSLLGRDELVMGQTGYKLIPSSQIVFEKGSDNLSDLTVSNKKMTIYNETLFNNQNVKITFTLGDNVMSNQGGLLGLTIRGAETTNYFKWIVPDKYYINVTSLKIIMTAFSGNNTVTLSSEVDNKSTSITANTSEKEISLSGLNLGNTGNIKLHTKKWASNDYYIKSLTYTYTLSYYELDLTALDKAISDAELALSTITDETMKGYLNAAIATANDQTFRNACAFPNSHWYKNNNNEIIEGDMKPSDVSAKADKLNAVTKYLLARTAANVYAETDVPNAVYNKLHPYDDLNPNDYTTDEVNGATAEINTAIELAKNTTEEYKKAKADIATAAARTDHNDATTLAEDVKRATDALEAATTIVAIEEAKKKIKEFDEIRFNSLNEIQEGSTLANPASANSSKVITYSSSDNTIIEIDGTTLKALKPGIVTITATTTTGNGYYGYATTKEFTVTPKAVILYPDKECTIVPYITYPEITLERSFSAKTHYTLTLPFDSKISDIGGDYAAQLALVTYNKADGYTLYFQKVAEGDMMANQPYIVYAENGFNESLKWTNITVAETIEAKEVCNDRTQGWTMQGNYTPGVNMEGNYGIAGGQFRLGTEGSYIDAYTAYFTFLGTQNVRARVAVMDEGGNTTYIGELKDGVLQTEEGIYGLDGVQQNQLRKGINIVRQKDGSVRKILK